MKLMTCPLNGPRNISEFVCAGEVKPLPSPDAAAETWARFTYIEANRAGPVFEWWLHVPSAYWFIAERDTRTDQILRTLSIEAFNKLAQATP
jgi:sarcosine oxidase, subunit delta